METRSGGEMPVPGVMLEGTGDGGSALVERLGAEDFLGQLLRREGRALELGSEGSKPQLDWVDGIERALARPVLLAAVEEEAAGYLRRGYRHLVWSGMGGSVMAVHVLKRLGFVGGIDATVHPLDSTDPAALNRLLRELAALEDEGQQPSALSDAPLDNEALRGALDRTLLVAVAMGMTSEEPITHAAWFWGLLGELGVENPEEHLQVIALEGSFLERYALERGISTFPLALEGECLTPGRMSAPSTRVFLRPAAWGLAASALARDPGATFDGTLLGAALRRAQAIYGVSRNAGSPGQVVSSGENPFVRLGAFISDQVTRQGRNKLLLSLPATWEGLAPWLEQLVEESLGKGGKGLLVFYGQDAPALAERRDDCMLLRLVVEGQPEPAAPPVGSGMPVLTLRVAVNSATGLPPGLGEVAGLFAGFELMVATFGYLQGIVFAGQPAVEGYKRYARELRDGGGPLPPPTDSPWKVAGSTLEMDFSALERAGLSLEELGQIAGAGEPPAALAALLALARARGKLGYLDITYNGEPTPEARAVFQRVREMGNGLMGIPVKMRTGPQDYHSTEQSETDGPPELTSIRFVCLEHEAALAGEYGDRFLLAQAYGTWRAMADARRWVVMATIPSAAEEAGAIARLLDGTLALLGRPA